MITLSDDQQDIKNRIKSAIETEIGMCDDYRDLIILASILYTSAKTIFQTYASEFGRDELEKAIVDCTFSLDK